MKRYQVKGSFVAEVQAEDEGDAIATAEAGFDRLENVSMGDGTLFEIMWTADPVVSYIEEVE